MRSVQIAAVLTVEVFGNGGADRFIAGIVHVAMQQQGWFFFQAVADGLCHLWRRGDAGISDAEIEDVFCPVFFGKAGTFLKHGADDRTVCGHCLHFF